MNKKEIILYIICGLITTVLNFVLFFLFNKIFNYKLANLITLIIVKVSAYVLNKIFVFKTKNNTKKELGKEFIKFIISRFITFLIDYFGLILLIELLSIDKNIGKIIMIIIVVIVNYVLSKKYVFKKDYV